LKGFVLYCGPENAELTLLLEKAATLDIVLTVVNPQRLEVILNTAESYLIYKDIEMELPDFVIAAFANDPSYHNQAVLQQLETLGVLCINTASCLQLTKDKLRTLQKLSQDNISVPKTMLYSPATDVSVIEREFSYPLVLKVIGGSKGDGVVLVKDAKHLANILQIASAGNIREELIIQEFIASSKGRDLRVVVIGGEARCCAKRIAAKSDGFKSNVSSGGSAVSYELTPEIIDITNRTAKSLGLFIGGVDLLFGDNGFVVCEANSVPGGFAPGNNIDWGMDVLQEILKSIQGELARR